LFAGCVRGVTQAAAHRPTFAGLLDDTVKLLVWTCRRHLINGDDEDLLTGPTWLAQRLQAPATRALAGDILTVAVREAQRAVEADPELEPHYAAGLALIARFERSTRRLLDGPEHLAAA
jgi:hypothetical protein